MEKMTTSKTEQNMLVSPALNSQDLEDLEQAFAAVEAGRGALVRLADLMGGAVGHATRLGIRSLGIAPKIEDKLRNIAETAITYAFEVAILGMQGTTPVYTTVSDDDIMPRWRDYVTRAAVVVSGAVGGFGGLVGFGPDVGFTTLTIMREIARIAREQGEDLNDSDTRKACLEVFALRAFPNMRNGEESELGFFSAKILLRGRPVVMLISEVASHYGFVLGQKLSLQLMPVAGALCGASLNAAFLAHYRALAQAHFIIRRLVREHGPIVWDTASAMRESFTAQGVDKSFYD
ncbi:MAG: EcsC family protein [Acetobacter sp.]|nr:EcsC family protein [Acetobacter sp.]